MTDDRISVVVPVYRSEGCVNELTARLAKALESCGGGYEIVLVNDGSPDGSWDRVVECAKRNPRILGVNLRKNFGQDNALMAGLRASGGRVVVIMDDDLQHAPEDIPNLVREVERGYDVCYAKFRRKRQAVWKNMGSWLNDKVANVVLGKPRDVYLSPFKAIAKAVVVEIVKYDGPFPYVDGLLFRVTRNVTQVEALHHGRYEGRGNFGLRRSVGTWLKVFTSFSLAPLRCATYLGFASSALGLCIAAFFVARQLVGHTAPPGWASTIVAVLVLGGIQLASIGLIGEYLGRVFLHLNKQPQYVVRDIVSARERTSGRESAAEGRR